MQQEFAANRPGNSNSSSTNSDSDSQESTEDGDFSALDGDAEEYVANTSEIST